MWNNAFTIGNRERVHSHWTDMSTSKVATRKTTNPFPSLTTKTTTTTTTTKQATYLSKKPCISYGVKWADLSIWCAFNCLFIQLPSQVKIPQPPHDIDPAQLHERLARDRDIQISQDLAGFWAIPWTRQNVQNKLQLNTRLWHHTAEPPLWVTFYFPVPIRIWPQEARSLDFVFLGRNHLSVCGQSRY